MAAIGELDVPRNAASVEVLGSDVATAESGTEVGGGGDIDPVACTKVTNAVSVPRAGPGRLDPLIPTSARDVVVSCRPTESADVLIDDGPVV
jgi:hypothetical protein